VLKVIVLVMINKKIGKELVVSSWKNRDYVSSFSLSCIFISMITLCLILPVDRNAGALPRQTWIDFCAMLASVLHCDPPQEPAKDETAPLRPITL